jgi:hypothetical protein
MMWGFCCADGWFDLLYDLCERLEPLVNELNYRLSPSDRFEVVQVKQKFGGLRFYVNHRCDGIDAEIEKAQMDSLHTCEHCGAVGTLRNRHRFIVILCDACNQVADSMARRFAERTVDSHFQFRLNGVIIPHIIVRPVVTNGEITEWELLACDEKIGSFVIDDNDDLPDPALPKFLLEVKDLSNPDRGWQQMSTQECIAMLESAGVIDSL